MRFALGDNSFSRLSPKMLLATQAKGEGYSTTSNARHFMAMSLSRMHQIFMQALAELR
jgi:hypothetical protein